MSGDNIEVVMRMIASLCTATGIMLIHADYVSIGAGLLTAGLFWLSR